MTEGAVQVLHDLVETRPFMDALDEFIRAEFEERISELRASVRSNNTPRVQQIEGELGILDQLPAMLRKYARKYIRP